MMMIMAVKLKMMKMKVVMNKMKNIRIARAW